MVLRYFLVVCFFFSSYLVNASDLDSIYVLTDRIIVLHFTDGYVKYHGYHQTCEEDITVKNELDILKAEDPNNFLITSNTDENFRVHVMPLKIGRKRKGCAFSMKCIPNDKDRCMSDYVLEHSIYLFLPSPLKTGQSYILNLKGLAKNKNQFELVYNYACSRSLAIHVNQVGYVPAAPVKHAYISQWMGDAGPLKLEKYSDSKFHLIRTKDGKEVFSGPISKQRDFATGGPDGPPNQGPNDNFVGTDVWQCDFSKYSETLIAEWRARL